MPLFSVGEVDRSLRTVRAGAGHPADHPVRANLHRHALAHMAGIEIPERESIEAIARLKASPMPDLRAGGFWVQANLAALDDVPAIDLYQQAIDVNFGTRTIEEIYRSMQLELIAQTDDLDAAFTGFTHVVDTWQTSLGDIYTGREMGALVTWLVDHGYHDDAARLMGAQLRGRRESWINPPPEIVTLPEVMGEAGFTAAFEAGAAHDVRVAAELARTVLVQARHDLIGD